MHFAVIGSGSHEFLAGFWEPLLKDLSAAIGRPVEPLYTSDYAGAVRALAAGQAQFGWMGNRAAIEAIDRAHCEVALQSVDLTGQGGYYSLLITRTDSASNSVNDVIAKSKTLALGLGDHNSTSGFTVPYFYIFTSRKLDPKSIFHRITYGNHEENALAVAEGRVDVATNNSRDLAVFANRHPDMYSRLKVIWQSPLIPSDPIVWRKDLPVPAKEALRAFFTRYGRNSVGKSEAQTKVERDNLAKMIWSGFKESSDLQLVPIRQLELFRMRQEVQAATDISPDVKERRLGEIDAKLEQLKIKAP